MHRLIFICILLVAAISSNAQSTHLNETPSELISDLQKSNPDSNRLAILLVLSQHYYLEPDNSGKKLDSAGLFLQQAEKLCNEIHFTDLEEWKAAIYFYLGKYYYKKGKISVANNYFNKIVTLFENLRPVDEQIACWKDLGSSIKVLDSIGLTRIDCFEKVRFLYHQLNNKEKEIEEQREIADTHMKQGKLVLAENELLDVLVKYKTIGFQDLHKTYNLLSVTNKLKGNYNKALEYALLVIESIRKTNDTADEINFYGNVADLYHELGRTDKSIEYFRVIFSKDPPKRNQFYYFRAAGVFVRDLIKQNKMEEARSFLFQFSKKYQAVGPYSKASLATTFAYYYNSIQNYSLADKYTREMIELEESLGKNNEIRRDVEYDIGQYYFNKKHFGEAAAFFQKALDEAELNNSANTIKDIDLALFKTDSALNHYIPAIKYLNQYHQLNDSMFNVVKLKQIEEVQVKYETEKKEQNIKLLEKESMLQQNRILQAGYTRNWILGGMGFLLAILALMFYNYRVKQRINKKLENQQKEIGEQNISLRHLVTEKEWLLKEIHHRVKNNLQIVMSLLNSQSAYIDNEPALTAIHDSQHRVHAMSLIHQKLYNSENVSSINISNYIHELVSYLSDSFNIGQRVRFMFAIEPIEIDVSQAIPLGLILNEAITNSIKYAFPDGRNGLISISLSANIPGQCLLIISDNGIGIPSSFKNKKAGSLGMSLMDGLSEDLAGKFFIENNQGTTIKIYFEYDPVVRRPDAFAESFASNN